MPIAIRLSYYPWITQNVTAQYLDQQIRRFAQILERELVRASAGATVTVLAPLEVPAQIEQLVGGAADLALMNPLGYVFAHAGDSAVQSIAVAQRVIDGKVGVVYYAQVYTHKRTAIRELAQAKGRTIAFGAKVSTSNFLVPANELRAKGLHPLSAFASVSFAGGHEKVAKAVYEGMVDLGAGHDGAIADLGNQYGYGDADACLVRLLRSAPIPSDPIALRSSDTALRKVVTEALVAAGKTADGKDALGTFWGGVVGLGATTPDAYDALTSALEALNLSAADILD
ncbi:MAG: PhnD/SsuA/transferrin family substrate-binding protein [Planctomycetia bacterium]|nr:PhnD/SsuA/transferrin family substrate-binding protein [Planctomycetia bacterium]